MIWNEIHSEIIDPVRLAGGLYKFRETREKEAILLRERLEVIADLIEEERFKLSKLLALYLSEDFLREMPIERRQRLETSIENLEQEQIRLNTVLIQKILHRSTDYEHQGIFCQSSERPGDRRYG